MKNERIRKWRNRFERKLLVFALLAAQAGFATVAGATYSLPASRSVTWTGNVGVKGDIPSRTTIYKTLSPSGGDNAPAIQAAISGCPAGQVVQLNAGTFTVSSPIKVKSGITLRGAGMGKTIIMGASGMSGNYVIGYSGYTFGSSVNITGGLSKGSTNITTASAHGWKAGDLILIDQLNNASDDPPVINVGNNGTCTWCGRDTGKRSIGQIVKVVTVPSSTTATLEIPLYWNYKLSLTPQATKINGVTNDAGIEDLTVNNNASGNSSQAGSGGTILLAGASNCWVLRVEGIGAWESLVKLQASYRNTIRSSKFHEPVPAKASADSVYGIWLNKFNSANAIENNQIYHFVTGFILNGATSGNVIAYNYITALNKASAPTWQLGALKFHGAHPIMNLIEGNLSDGRYSGDNVWGSSSQNTLFRNRNTLTPGKTGATWDFDFHRLAQYHNFVGNIIGESGVETTYELNNVTVSGQKAIYRFGYAGDGDKDASGNDPAVAATALQHGNWDSATNGIVWNGSDDRTLPPSLYLTAKPSWWGTMQWPCIGPDVSPMYPSALGAGNGTPWDSKTLLAPPSNLKTL